MADIRPYLKISDSAKSIKEIFTSPESFSDYYKKVLPQERKAVLHHFIVNNKPFSFDLIPILFERIKDYLSDVLDVDHNCVKLIGSAKTGFSLSEDEYGKKFDFDGSRDLDFTVIDVQLFENLHAEFEKWADSYQRGKISPTNAEEKRWKENVSTGKNQLRNNFFDLKYIPNREEFPLKSSVAQALYLVKVKLEEYHGLKVRVASIRVYKTWNSFISMLMLNTNKILKSN